MLTTGLSLVLLLLAAAVSGELAVYDGNSDQGSTCACPANQTLVVGSSSSESNRPPYCVSINPASKIQCAPGFRGVCIADKVEFRPSCSLPKCLADGCSAYGPKARLIQHEGQFRCLVVGETPKQCPDVCPCGTAPRCIRIRKLCESACPTRTVTCTQTATTTATSTETKIKTKTTTETTTETTTATVTCTKTIPHTRTVTKTVTCTKTCRPTHKPHCHQCRSDPCRCQESESASGEVEQEADSEEQQDQTWELQVKQPWQKDGKQQEGEGYPSDPWRVLGTGEHRDDKQDQENSTEEAPVGKNRGVLGRARESQRERAGKKHFARPGARISDN